MAARNTAHRDDHGAISESVSQGDAQQPQAGFVGIAQELVGADGSRAEKDQSKSAEKFGGELLHSAVGKPRRRNIDRGIRAGCHLRC